MKAKQKLSLAGFLLCCFMQAVQASVPVIHLYDTSSSYKCIGGNLSFLEDRQHTFTFEYIKNSDSLFCSAKEKVPNFGTTKSVMWVMFEVNLHSKNPWLFELDAPWIDSLIIYSPQNGGYTTRYLGRRFPIENQDFKTPDLIFKISPEEFLTDTVLRFYLRANGKSLVFPAYIGTPETVIEQQNTKSVFYAVYLGIVLTLVISYLAIFITSKQRENLYYILWIVASSWYFALIKGYLRLALPSSFHFLLHHTVEPLAIAGFMMLLFNRNSLHIRMVLPSFKKWFDMLLWSMVGIVLLCVFGFDQLALVIFEPLMLVMMAFSFIAGLMVYRKGNKYALFYSLAYAQTLINVGVYILVFMKLLEYNSYTSNASLIGTLIETIMLSLGLGAKIRGIEIEKKKAQELVVATLQESEKMIKQQNELLENKVIERTHQLELEKRKSDDLLRNILPMETVNELKLTGYSKPKMFDSVTILFTDFKDFTSISEHVKPEELVAEIGYCYSAFDRILGKYGIEKIKTIGDSYMCAGGLPTPTDTHAVKTVAAAREILNFMLERKKMEMAEGEIRFEIRIGINTGPVVAGVVGVKKFAFDIWGDAVNTASRMEQNSEGGKINISGSTYELVKDKFKCTYRGKIEAKNKGMIDMYFVD